MGTGIALWKGDTWDVGWGTLTLGEHSGLVLHTADGEARLPLPLARSAFVDAYATDKEVWAVGGADEQVVLAFRNGPRIDIVLRAQRLEPAPGADVGGHAVRFHPLSDGHLCLLTWEFGAALLDPEAGCRWSHLHRDPELRLRKLSSEVVELAGLHRTITISVADGSVTSRVLNHQVGVDKETFAEWRRGIGR